MRQSTNKMRLEAFLEAFGNRVTGPGRIYLTGGATAVLHGWRQMTIDVDLKADPEPRGFFEAIAALKDELDMNVELASPDQFIPPVPGWQERSQFIARYGEVEFFHYDIYSQALAKIERGHDRDISDVVAMHEVGLIDKARLEGYFRVIENDLVKYPAIDRATFDRSVCEFCHDVS